MKKIEITENFGRYRRGQVVEMDDFDIGHALAFKYGKIYAGKPVEIQAVIQPETRTKEPQAPPIEIKVEPKKPEAVEPKKDKAGFFKRTPGRRPKT